MSKITHLLRHTADVWRHDRPEGDVPSDPLDLLTSMGHESDHYEKKYTSFPCRAEKTQNASRDTARSLHVVESFWLIWTEPEADINAGDRLKNVQSSEGVVIARDLILAGLKPPTGLTGLVDHLEFLAFEYEDNSSLEFPVST